MGVNLTPKPTAPARRKRDRRRLSEPRLLSLPHPGGSQAGFTAAIASQALITLYGARHSARRESWGQVLRMDFRRNNGARHARPVGFESPGALYRIIPLDLRPVRAGALITSLREFAQGCTGSEPFRSPPLP